VSGTDSDTSRLLDHRVALVTGGARRIGRALVLALAGQGAKVFVHYLTSEAEARETVAEARALGAEAALLPADLADPGQAEDLLAEAGRQQDGPVDILVNNAAIFQSGSLASTTAADWDRHQAINLRAPLLLSQAFARALPADLPGDIINLNDIRALRPGADYLAYTGSKMGLHGLTRSLALALAPRIRVNELALGAVLSPDKAGAEYPHVRREEIPARRFGDPQEVARAILFLLASPLVTGQTLYLDGGLHLL